MSDEAHTWISYAEENRRAARLMLTNGLFNPCLHNCQQAVEKLLKAVLIHIGEPLRRTHSITELAGLLQAQGVVSPLSEDECDLLDSI